MRRQPSKEELLRIAESDPGVFRPTERQRQIWELMRNAAKEGGVTLLGYGGAAGGGKTRMIVEMAIDLALNYPGNRILIGRKDFNDLSSTVMEAFFRHVPKELIDSVNNNQHWVKLRAGGWPKGITSVIRFRELKDWTGLGSEEYGAVLVDEAAEVSTDSVLMLLSRLRWKLPPEIDPDGNKMAYFFIAASNPYPGWFKEWFVDKKLSSHIEGLGNLRIHFVPAKASDNPYLPPHYETFLRAIYPATWVKRLMDGDWDVYIGQVYPQFDPEIHEWKMRDSSGKIVIPGFTKLVGGIDFGHPSNTAHKTAAIVGGITKTNRLIRLAVFEDASHDVYEKLVNWMAEQERIWGPYLFVDTSERRMKVFGSSMEGRIIWCADRTQIGWIQEMRKAFVIMPSKGGRGSVKWGIGLVSNRLNVDETGKPGSYYLPGMYQFVDAMRRYAWPEPVEGQPPPTTPIKVDDDLVDADRYMHELVDRFAGDPQALANEIPRIADEATQMRFAKVFGEIGAAHRRQERDLSYIFEREDAGIKVF